MNAWTERSKSPLPLGKPSDGAELGVLVVVVVRSVSPIFLPLDRVPVDDESTNERTERRKSPLRALSLLSHFLVFTRKFGTALSEEDVSLFCVDRREWAMCVSFVQKFYSER